MTQFILTKESPEIIRFFRNISTLSKMLDDQEKNFRPVLNGERYITDSELAEKLKLTRRTLADYRMNGRLPYYCRVIMSSSRMIVIIQPKFVCLLRDFLKENRLKNLLCYALKMLAYKY
jgi:hypothetical protein